MGFDKSIFNSFDRDWALVTAGTPGDFNTMTISWGGLGTLWELPVATVYVKPVRYTHDFLERCDFFTGSFFPEQYREDLNILGSRSGRDEDKMALTSLTPIACGESVAFKEAEQTLLCRKIYRQDLDIRQIPEDVIRTYYTVEAPHTMYIGEVIGGLQTGKTEIKN